MFPACTENAAAGGSCGGGSRGMVIAAWMGKTGGLGGGWVIGGTIACRSGADEMMMGIKGDCESRNVWRGFEAEG